MAQSDDPRFSFPPFGGRFALRIAPDHVGLHVRFRIRTRLYAAKARVTVHPTDISHLTLTPAPSAGHLERESLTRPLKNQALNVSSSGDGPRDRDTARKTALEARQDDHRRSWAQFIQQRQDAAALPDRVYPFRRTCQMAATAVYRVTRDLSSSWPNDLCGTSAL